MGCVMDKYARDGDLPGPQSLLLLAPWFAACVCECISRSMRSLENHLSSAQISFSFLIALAMI